MHCTAVPEAQNAIQHATIAINRTHTHSNRLLNLKWTQQMHLNLPNIFLYAILCVSVCFMDDFFFNTLNYTQCETDQQWMQSVLWTTVTQKRQCIPIYRFVQHDCAYSSVPWHYQNHAKLKLIQSNYLVISKLCQNYRYIEEKSGLWPHSVRIWSDIMVFQSRL